MAGLSTPALRFLAVALVAAGLGAGIYFAVQAAGGGEDAQVVAQATETPTPLPPTDTPAPPTPTVTELLPTQPPPTVPPPTGATKFPTPDTRVAIMDRPTLDQIQLGPDGKYFIADRGDGCRWVERLRLDVPDLGEEVILGTDCPAGFQFVFRPGTGEIILEMP